MDVQSGRFVFGYDPTPVAVADLAEGPAAPALRRPRNPANGFRDLPIPTGTFPFRMNLAAIIGPDGIANITAAGKMVFHVAGDTGQKSHGGDAQDAIGHHISQQAKPTLGANRARFFYIPGDVVYFNGERKEYEPQFYEPYRNYPGPIFAIPGNHDGAVPARNTPLQGFMEHFCSEQPVHSSWAGESMRTTMTQPNCYWTLIAPYATIIGLYSNVPGKLDHNSTRQFDWLVGELRAAAADRFVIVTVHHPPYSRDTAHGGYDAIGEALDRAFRQANRIPHLVLCGHVHNYQRFERDMTTFAPGRTTSYVIAGAGGFAGFDSLHRVEPGDALPGGVTPKVHEDRLPGFLRMTVTPNEIHGEYFAVARPPHHLDGPPQRKDEFRIAR